MSTLTPGLYRATVRGVADTIVMVHEDGTAMSVANIERRAFHKDIHITDARPLIVLDLGDDDPHHYIKALCQAEKKNYAYNLALRNLADQIAQQTKPARIPEPGLWGVVEASCCHSIMRSPWVKDELGWARIGHQGVLKTYNHDGWGDLIDPVLIRPGIEES